MRALLDARSKQFIVYLCTGVLLFILLLIVAPLVWSVLQMFIIAGLLSLALNKPVAWQVRRGAPRWAAVLVTLLLVLLIIGTFVYFLVPTVVAQFQQLVVTLPATWEALMRNTSALLNRFPGVASALDLPQLLPRLLIGAGSWASAARTVFATAIGAFSAIIFILIITMYTLMDPWPLVYGLRGLFPTEWWPKLDHIASSIAEYIHSWVIGTIILGVVIGVLDYTALALINAFLEPNLPFILLFAIIGGLLEGIPIAGPIIATFLPSLVAFSIDPVLGLIVLTAFIIIQQLENYIIAPLVMRKALSMHPVSLMFSLIMLTGLFGIFGAFIATPVAAVMKVLYEEWYYPLVHHGRAPETPPEELSGERITHKTD